MPGRTITMLAPAMLLAVALAGCAAEDPRTASLRKQFVLSEEPAGARNIVDARDHVDEQPEVVVVGRIHSGDFEPWAKGKAAFVISEATAPADDHADTPGHDPTTCPFCRRRAEKANATALVQFCDESGEPLPIDARDLLGVKENQVVVVQGQGQVNDAGLLIIAAKGIHLRR